MAYGKIKADAFIYDDGGSDTEITAATIASNSSKANTASPTFTGSVTLPGTIQVGGQATDITMGASNANALEFKQGSTTYLKFDTNNQNVQLSKPMVSSSDITLNGQQELRLADSDSSNYCAIKAPATVGTNRTWTLPSAAPTANQIIQFATDGTISYTDPPQGFYEGTALLTDTLKAASTAHPVGTTANTWVFNTDLTRTAYDPNNIVTSLSSGVFTLEAGTYDVFWTQSSTFCNGFVSGLFTSNGNLQATGMRGHCSASYDYYAHVHGWHRFTIGSQTGFKIGLKTAGSGTYYFGAYNYSQTSQTNIYDNSVQIFKLAS